MSATASYDKRVQRYAYAALAADALLAVWLALQGDGRIGNLEIPVLALLGAILVGAVLGVVAVARRSDLLAGLALAALVLAILPGGVASPGLGTYALGALFGLAALLLLELVHMTSRYERAHRAVETENVPEEHINRVTDESLKTLLSRAALASAAVALAIGGAFVLQAAGPRQWRAAVETSAPLGVAVVALALAGAASLFILARGAKLRLRREPRPKELLPDAVE